MIWYVVGGILIFMAGTLFGYEWAMREAIKMNDELITALGREWENQNAPQ